MSTFLLNPFVFQEVQAQPGQQAYTTPGTYTWVAPARVTSVCVVCVGGGGGGLVGSSSGAGGGGGGLGWKNNISVTPGQSYTVVVGAGGSADTNTANSSTLDTGTSGGDSYFIDTSTVAGRGGERAYWVTSVGAYSGAGGSYVGDGGGSGGAGSDYAQNPASATRSGGGGGAGGYSGNGGSVKPLAGETYAGTVNQASQSGSGGGGGGGGYGADGNIGGGGGGVGILGEGSNGGGGTNVTTGAGGVGGGGSGGTNGGNPNGGTYGGGAGSRDQNTGVGGTGGGGAVRIIWGTGRAFPSTNTGNV